MSVVLLVQPPSCLAYSGRSRMTGGTILQRPNESVQNPVVSRLNMTVLGGCQGLYTHAWRVGITYPWLARIVPDLAACRQCQYGRVRLSLATCATTEAACLVPG
eukprot:2324937-Rhodomonas_salina.1